MPSRRLRPSAASTPVSTPTARAADSSESSSSVSLRASASGSGSGRLDSSLPLPRRLQRGNTTGADGSREEMPTEAISPPLAAPLPAPVPTASREVDTDAAAASATATGQSERQREEVVAEPIPPRRPPPRPPSAWLVPRHHLRGRELGELRDFAEHLHRLLLEKMGADPQGCAALRAAEAEADLLTAEVAAFHAADAHRARTEGQLLLRLRLLEATGSSSSTANKAPTSATCAGGASGGGSLVHLIRKGEALDAIELAPVCIACLDAPAVLAAVPCGHRCLCLQHATALAGHSKCPVCRQRLGQLVRIY